jgi:hypothetical protein
VVILVSAPLRRDQVGWIGWEELAVHLEVASAVWINIGFSREETQVISVIIRALGCGGGNLTHKVDPAAHGFD